MEIHRDPPFLQVTVYNKNRQMSTKAYDKEN